MTSSKEREILMNVIELYRDMPYLWQKQHKDFKNKNLREEGFRVLLEIYKNFDDKATVKTIKKKMLNMCTNYNKELSKVTSSKRTGAGTEDVYLPSLWYFEAMSFMGSRSEPCRATLDTIGSDEDLHSSDEDISVASTSTGQPSTKKRRESLLQKQEKFFKSAETLLSNKEEDWEIFGKSVGLQMKDLSGRQIIFAQKVISDVIYNAKLERLSEDSCLFITPMPEHRRSTYNLTSVPSPVSNYSSPSPYYDQSPQHSSHNHPSSRPSSRPSSSSSNYSQPPRYQSQLIRQPAVSPVQAQQQPISPQQQAMQSPQHTIQFTQHTIQSPQHPNQSQQRPIPPSQHTIQSPQHTIQWTQHPIQSQQQIPHIEDDSETNLSSCGEGPANVMKDFLVFRSKKE